jgi:hypothetical protein
MYFRRIFVFTGIEKRFDSERWSAQAREQRCRPKVPLTLC